MSQVTVFMAFPDGGLAYDCGTCTQPCCRTSALVTRPEEAERLVAAHPFLALLSVPGAGGYACFTTPPSGCWFLEGGRCALVGQTELRPAACGLFPFNQLAWLDGALVVAPSALCPLDEVPDGTGIPHASVFGQLEIHRGAGAPPEVLRSGWEPTLALERRILAAATAALGDASPLGLVAAAELATEGHLDGETGLLEWMMLAEAAPRWQLHLERAVRVLGIPPPGDEALAAVSPLLAAWTPSLRLFAFDAIPLRRLPAACLALAVLAAHWQSLRPGRRLIPQALAQLASSLRPTIALLATQDDLAERLGPVPPHPEARHARTSLLRRLGADCLDDLEQRAAHAR